MHIISTIGGGGSTFVLRALDRRNYRSNFLGIDPFRIKHTITVRKPSLLNVCNFAMRCMGLYSPRFKVLMRPDAYWTDWAYHETGTWDPNSARYPQDLQAQKAYILEQRHKRSAGLYLQASDLHVGTLSQLVQSYVHCMKRIEQENKFAVVLVSGHWGEYGIFKELGLETIYLVRDPYNSLISHSKPIRHEKDYLRRGLESIDTKEWIDTYLSGPHHYWINHAESALSHDNAIIVRYNRFAEDWRSVRGLPDISSEFSYTENEVTKFLGRESIDYIYQQTKDICRELGFEHPLG